MAKNILLFRFQITIAPHVIRRVTDSILLRLIRMLMNLSVIGVFHYHSFVLSIALYKMQHVILPDGKHEGDRCFVLTADTMSHDKMGVVHGKPVDRADAIAKIKATAAGSFLCTGFCLDRKVWKNGCMGNRRKNC